MGRLSGIVLLGALWTAQVWGEIQIDDPYLALLAPQGQAVACMVLENQGDTVVRLLGARTPEGLRAQLGQGRWDAKQGRYGFRPLSRLVVPAGGRAWLQPLGFWLWLPAGPDPGAGPQTLLLEFDDGSELRVSLPVRQVASPATAN